MSYMKVRIISVLSLSHSLNITKVISQNNLEYFCKDKFIRYVELKAADVLTIWIVMSGNEKKKRHGSLFSLFQMNFCLIFVVYNCECPSRWNKFYGHSAFVVFCYVLLIHLYRNTITIVLKRYLHSVLS